jgi:DNA-binding NarL/FixJ family response regulator
LTVPIAAPRRTTGLSPTEQLVFERLLAGDTNGEIAHSRRTSPRTVANQIAAIFRKLGVGSRRELVAQAGRRNDPAPHRSAGALGGAPRIELTPRERQVAEFAAIGHSNKEIAYELGVSASTVGVLLMRAASKLGVASPADLVRALRSAARK